MAVLGEGEVRARARRRAQDRGRTVEDELAASAQKTADRYDVFLSQTIRDAEIVLGVYDLLTEMGLSVFCDWIATPEIDRSAVSPANAEFIRLAMSVSDTLLFLDTENADQSRWMCWEIGWFDGENGHVAVLPVLPEGARDYRGREFLGLYPYVELDEEGKLRIVRPYATNRHGVSLFESPNSTSFERWRGEGPARMRPRIIEDWRI